MIIETEGWLHPKTILVILAHPDDPEFFCGASIARWCAAGHKVHYCLLTKGQKGAPDLSLTPVQLGEKRVLEQNAAAEVLGVKSVEFLDYIDGELFPDNEMRKKIVRVIRNWKPEILVTCDPQSIFPADNRINHPDHRAAGQVVIDAVFPAAGSPTFFPELTRDEHLVPHQVEEVWMSLTTQPNVALEVFEFFETKLKALHCHTSQVNRDFKEFDEMMRQRIIVDPETGKKCYEERFKRIKFT